MFTDTGYNRDCVTNDYLTERVTRAFIPSISLPRVCSRKISDSSLPFFSIIFHLSHSGVFTSTNGLVQPRVRLQLRHPSLSTNVFLSQYSNLCLSLGSAPMNEAG